MRALVDAAIALLLAPTCASCERPLARPTRGCVCEQCWSGVAMGAAPHCLRCGEPARLTDSVITACEGCLTVPVSVQRVRAIGPYTGPLRAILHALKYDGRRSLAAPLAARMRLAGQDLLREAQVVVPVPLHGRRRRERGFNQAADLAAHLGLPVVHALTRVRSTPSQTTLHADERRTNMHGAFQATAHARTLRGCAVVLVDDVHTTGATLDACAVVLREAGVEVVFALTAARVGSSRQP